MPTVLLEPGKQFFEDPTWSNLGVDWEEELKPHYETVCPHARYGGLSGFPQDGRNICKATAESLGAAQYLRTGAPWVFILEDQESPKQIPISGEKALPVQAATSAASA